MSCPFLAHVLVTPFSRLRRDIWSLSLKRGDVPCTAKRATGEPTLHERFKGKERKNASRDPNRTWVPRVREPTSILVRHSDVVEAVYIF